MVMPAVQVALLEGYCGPKEPLKPAVFGDAGYDLYATTDVTIKPGRWALVPTGIAIALSPGYEAQVRPRSGNALKFGFTVLNTPGTIDSGYRGEIGVIAYNAQATITVDDVLELTSRGPHQRVVDRIAARTIEVKRGQKIAQLVFNKVEHPEIVVVDTLPESARDAAGFGSTGS